MWRKENIGIIVKVILFAILWTALILVIKPWKEKEVMIFRNEVNF